MINQCDGCRRGLPVKDGIHSGIGYDHICCTADMYSMTVDIDGKKFEADWLHGTYNATLWLALAQTDMIHGEQSYDIYHAEDRKEIGIESEPKHITVEGEVLLLFYHGRESVEQHMDDWGTTGPRLTVDMVELDGTGISFRVKGDVNQTRINYTEGLVLWDGVFYGDIDISKDDPNAEG